VNGKSIYGLELEYSAVARHSVVLQKLMLCWEYLPTVIAGVSGVVVIIIGFECKSWHFAFAPIPAACYHLL